MPLALDATMVTQHEPVKKGAWYSLWVLVIVSLIAFVDRQILALQTEQVAQSLSLRDSQIGLIQGLGSAAFAMVATYPLGWLTDRLDRRAVLIGCILIWSIGTAACGFAQGFWSLFLAVLAISAGEAGLPALAYSTIPDLFKGRRLLLANQVFYIAMILSAAVGIGFGGGADLALNAIRGSLPSVLDGVETWRLLFILVAIPSVVLIPLVAASRLGERPALPVIEADEPQGTTLRDYMREHGGTVGLVVTALTFYGLPFLAVLVWTPAALTRIFGTSPGTNGLGLGAGLGIGCIVGVALANVLMRRLRPRLGESAALRVAFYALVASLPLAVLYAFVQSAWQCFAIVGALMASGTLIGSLLPGILQNLAPPLLRGRVTAIYGIVSTITSGIGVSLIGPFSDQFPDEPRALLIGVGTLLAISWAIAAVLMRKSEEPFARLRAKLEQSGES